MTNIIILSRKKKRKVNLLPENPSTYTFERLTKSLLVLWDTASSRAECPRKKSTEKVSRVLPITAVVFCNTTGIEEMPC